MHYDPVKNIFAQIIKKVSFLRILFYKILDLMFLRSWYVRRELKKLRKNLAIIRLLFMMPVQVSDSIHILWLKILSLAKFIFLLM